MTGPAENIIRKALADTSPAPREPPVRGPDGPFYSEQQARQSPAAMVVWEAFNDAPGPGRMAPFNQLMLVEAAESAGVELGTFDQRILAWLAGFEPSTCAAISGIIRRAARKEPS